MRAARLAAIIGCPKACRVRRGAAQGDRRNPSGRDRQPHRPSRRRLPSGPARPFDLARPRRAGARARRDRGKTGEARSYARARSAHPAPPRHARAPRRARARRAARGFMRPSKRPPIGDRPTSPNCFWCQASAAHGPRARDGGRVVHGAPYRFTDPARFSFAHGGKDRHPFPVPLKVYDETISAMKAAVQKAKLGQDDRLAALKRLDDEARRVERRAAGPPVLEVIAEECGSRIPMAAAACSARSRRRRRFRLSRGRNLRSNADENAH